MDEKKVKNQEAITLIALVITIIVLLILAGVSIAMLTGENGILTQAVNAKEQTEIKTVLERANLDILEIQSYNLGNLTKTQFLGVLAKYFESSTIPDEDTLPDDMSTLEESVTVTTKEEYGSHTIKLGEIWDGEFFNEQKEINFTFQIKYNTSSSGDATETSNFKTLENTSWEKFIESNGGEILTKMNGMDFAIRIDSSSNNIIGAIDSLSISGVPIFLNEVAVGAEDIIEENGIYATPKITLAGN